MAFDGVGLRPSRGKREDGEKHMSKHQQRDSERFRDIHPGCEE